jgi:hypothetical protein
MVPPGAWSTCPDRDSRAVVAFVAAPRSVTCSLQSSGSCPATTCQMAATRPPMGRGKPPLRASAGGSGPRMQLHKAPLPEQGGLLFTINQRRVARRLLLVLGAYGGGTSECGRRRRMCRTTRIPPDSSLLRWTAFELAGGVESLGNPVSRRFEWDGLSQAFRSRSFALECSYLASRRVDRR